MIKLTIRIATALLVNDIFNIYNLCTTTIDINAFYRGNTGEFGKILSRIPILIITYFLYYLIFYDIYLDGYHKTFHLFKNGFIFILLVKSICNLFPLIFADEILNMVKNFDLCMMVLIALSEPIVNTTVRPNRTSFIECYTRYLESEILLFAYYLISRDTFSTGIDDEMIKGSLVYVIGDYDCFRYTAFLFICHYFYVLINSLAFSFK
jgi:hypothetical protein